MPQPGATRRTWLKTAAVLAGAAAADSVAPAPLDAQNATAPGGDARPVKASAQSNVAETTAGKVRGFSANGILVPVADADPRWTSASLPLRGASVRVLQHRPLRDDDRGGADARDLAGKIADAWIAFARTCNPNYKGLPKWPEFTAAQCPTMVFDNTCAVANAPDADQRRILTL